MSAPSKAAIAGQAFAKLSANDIAIEKGFRAAKRRLKAFAAIASNLDLKAAAAEAFAPITEVMRRAR